MGAPEVIASAVTSDADASSSEYRATPPKQSRKWQSYFWVTWAKSKEVSRLNRHHCRGELIRLQYRNNVLFARLDLAVQ